MELSVLDINLLAICGFYPFLTEFSSLEHRIWQPPKIKSPTGNGMFKFSLSNGDNNKMISIRLFRETV